MYGESTEPSAQVDAQHVEDVDDVVAGVDIEDSGLGQGYDKVGI